ncbi:MAG: hypothetical protein AAF074_17130 [Pseudomonadota bacterium]
MVAELSPAERRIWEELRAAESRGASAAVLGVVSGGALGASQATISRTLFSLLVSARIEQFYDLLKARSTNKAQLRELLQERLDRDHKTARILLANAETATTAHQKTVEAYRSGALSRAALDRRKALAARSTLPTFEAAIEWLTMRDAYWRAMIDRARRDEIETKDLTRSLKNITDRRREIVLLQARVRASFRD